ncbi:hypothetical protein [uncultured Kordia sp.]|uniref:hypothetical protein n=1 Tax=uncultured Kordia sp. TaxID=507699 RepID=UPI0026268964|nr:hypothetical protein [uncultured Kordia sp.]
MEENIYKDLNDKAGFSTYRIGITIHKKHSLKELNTLVEPYFLYVEKELALKDYTKQYFILGGELEDIQKFKSMFK